jgi:cytochrome c peroxidase
MPSLPVERAPGSHVDYSIGSRSAPVSVGTDPGLALKTRRGTGYYKVPSLKGVWYRGMFGHSGWCATLETGSTPAGCGTIMFPRGSYPKG